MRLIHVIASMDPQQGGVSQAVRSMIAGLAGEGISNEVVSLDDPAQQFLSANTFPIINALGPAKGRWCYSDKLIPWLLKNIPRFDGIVVHGLWLYPGYAVKKALRRYAKQLKTIADKKQVMPKLFIMPHGMLDPYFQQAKGRKLKALRNKIYWKLIEGGIVNNSYKILFTSEEECTLAKRTFSPYKPKTEAVVGLGVDEPPLFITTQKEAFAQICPAIGNSPYLLFLSRIHEKKGLDLLVNAYAAFLKKMHTSTVTAGGEGLPKLVIAGPGIETQYGSKISALISADSLLSQNVFFTGMLTGNPKWGALYGCEAFILPSHQENFGIAVVEAMACQKPVLITNKINIWREIKKTGSGIISSPTLEGIAILLKTWFELNQEKKVTMGRNAHLLFRTAFAIKAAAKQLAAVLK